MVKDERNVWRISLVGFLYHHHGACMADSSTHHYGTFTV